MNELHPQCRWNCRATIDWSPQAFSSLHKIWIKSRSFAVSSVGHCSYMLLRVIGNVRHICASICVFFLVCTSVGSECTFAALCSGTGPAQDVGRCSASFDWQHFFGEAGSSGIDSVFHNESAAFFFFPSSSFFHLLSFCFLFWLSARHNRGH